MAFYAELAAEFGAGISTYCSADGARLDVTEVLAKAPANAVFYICGSERLVGAVVDAAGRLKVDLQRVRVERFSADLPADARSFDLELTRSGKRLTVAADQTVLDAVLDAGVDVPFSCRTGLCGTCKVKVVDGRVDHRDSVLQAQEREGSMCACVSRAAGESLAIEL
jgi:ferredoxin